MNWRTVISESKWCPCLLCVFFLIIFIPLHGSRVETGCSYQTCFNSLKFIFIIIILMFLACIMTVEAVRILTVYVSMFQSLYRVMLLRTITVSFTHNHLQVWSVFDEKLIAKPGNSSTDTLAALGHTTKDNACA